MPGKRRAGRCSASANSEQVESFSFVILQVLLAPTSNDDKIYLGVECEFIAEPEHGRQKKKLIESNTDLQAIVDRNPRRS